MNKHIIITLAVVAAVITSCQPRPKDGQNASAAPEDSVVSQSAKPAESGYADVNGLKMYYEVYGEGKPIVLVHGSYMNIPMNWSQIIPLLAGDRKVIVAEMQGHGRTKDIPRELSYEGMADDVSGLLKHLKIDSADVLGYSMGGGVAFQVAVRHPEQVRRLVVLSGAYAHDGWWPEVEAAFATFTPDMFKGTPIQKQYDSLGNDPAHFEEFIKKVISIDLKPYDWSKDVKNIQAPIFMAIGDADGVRYGACAGTVSRQRRWKNGRYKRFAKIPPCHYTGYHAYRHDVSDGLADTHDHRFPGFRSERSPSYFLAILFESIHGSRLNAVETAFILSVDTIGSRAVFIYLIL